MPPKPISAKAFIPLNSILLINSKSIEEINPESITIELVGEKAFGLACLPKFWTFPFIVISDELVTCFKSFNKKLVRQLLNPWINNIFEASKLIGINLQDRIIVRSSGHLEGLQERGKFYSVEGEMKDIYHPILKCLNALSSDKDLIGHKIPLVIQKYPAAISAKGHLSNESRFYKELRDWVGEFDDLKKRKDKEFKINIRNWRKKIAIGNQISNPLFCNLSPQVPETLKIPAAWGYQLGKRLHFEWVWDGDRIYLVQADQERLSDGLDPTKIILFYKKSSSRFIPKCIQRVDENHAKKYNKIHNVFIYMKLKLPFTQLYILDNQSIIKDLASGKLPPELKSDLLELIKSPLVIRTDIAKLENDNYQFLPRTDGVHDVDSAFGWLSKNSMEIQKDFDQDIAFIFHNFIPATSSAFALAVPNERKVQIEAIWGLPEGLYYNKHDKYIVDTINPFGRNLSHNDIKRFELQKRINFKNFFVAPDPNHHWKTQILNPKYSWRPSIKRIDWVKKIALESRRIAEEEGFPLSIMWFVGVPKQACSSPIFPWYHEYYDPAITRRSLTQRTKTPFDKSLIIKTKNDIELLDQEAQKIQSRVRRVRIQPQDESLLRDKNTLRQIGELTKKINAVILLEGGVLSHAYYQLMQTGATVEVPKTFEDLEDKKEFDKLVRDNVPSNIERGGEYVVKTSLTGEYKLKALRQKLIEESFEVLDSSLQNTIIEELADVNEVIDEILSMLNVSRDELQEYQKRKRQKAGGFKKGYVLLETKNPPPTEKEAKDTRALLGNEKDLNVRDVTIHGRKVIESSHTINKWSDRRDHNTAEELLLKLVIPLIRDTWATTSPEITIGTNSNEVVRARIKGKRLGVDLQIEISFFVPHKQLSLF